MQHIKFRNIYTIRIVYKSGYVHDFKVYKFSFNGSTYSWDPVEDTNKPINIGADEIAAVYQIGHKRKIIWS